MIETDVLIVGSGPAGSSAGLMLSTYGIPNVIVTKYGWLANTPRAHLNNQRTMEILRDLGIEPEVVAKASPQDILGNAVFCTSLAGEELDACACSGRSRGVAPIMCWQVLVA